MHESEKSTEVTQMYWIDQFYVAMCLQRSAGHAPYIATI